MGNCYCTVHNAPLNSYKKGSCRCGNCRSGLCPIPMTSWLMTSCQCGGIDAPFCLSVICPGAVDSMTLIIVIWPEFQHPPQLIKLITFFKPIILHRFLKELLLRVLVRMSATICLVGQLSIIILFAFTSSRIQW